MKHANKFPLHPRYYINGDVNMYNVVCACIIS